MLQKISELLTMQPEFFIDLFLTHMRISALAVSIAGIIGLLLGIFISEREKLASPILSVVNVLYTFPSIAILGILISFTGIGDMTAIIALVIYGMLPMVRNTYVGLKNVDVNIIEAAHAMGSTKEQILYKIKLPLAFPVIMSGIRSMVTMTIALGGISSFIGAGGLGVAIYRGITTNNTPMILAGSLLVAMLALICDLILGRFEKHVLRTKKIGKLSKSVVALIVILALGTTIYPYFGASSDIVRIATKPNTEGYILGEMMAAIIRQDTNLEVELIHGIGGGTSNIHPAMVKGEFDIYPEYTGTVWNVILKEKSLYNEDKFDEMNQKYNEQFKITWNGLYGFNNTYALVVRTEIAKKYNLKTYSDLAKVSSKLTFGANYDYYEREDGFKSLSKEYGFNFKELLDMDTGLKYQAIKENKVDVVSVFTTDGRLATSDVVVLEDDKHFFPSYYAGSVIRTETLKKHPEVGAALEKLTNILDDEKMSKLNNSVESEGKNPDEVAQSYLKEIGLLEVK